MKYRAEIDGLRALAVIPVILFHAGFEWFSGGFVGVDVFFVISGYLITTIIISEMGEDKFSLIYFYERRARRILPAIFFVMLVCIPFALIWLPPADLKGFGISLAAVSTFSSNILFWSESGYFDTAAELKPLLHTWSLAVEEQFYILFPLFLILTWRFGIKSILILLLTIFLISLGVAQWGAYNSPSASFFLLPTRGWELLIGVFIAFYLKHNSYFESHILNQLFSLFGLSMIVYSIFTFDKTTPFPSFYALIPTIGTGLLILCAVPNTLIHKLLSLRFIVGIGLISYSAYLWHQPLLAFARHRLLGDISDFFLIFLCIASMTIAWFSWRFIEMPFRTKNNFNRKNIFLMSSSMIMIFCVVGMYIYASTSIPSKINLTDKVISVPHKFKGHVYEDRNCFSGLISDDGPCEIFGNGQLGEVIIVGDSHASVLAESFLSSINSFYSLLDLTASGCPFLINTNIFIGRNFVCSSNFQSARQDKLRDRPNSTVIYHSRLPLYFYGNGFDNEIPGGEEIWPKVRTIGERSFSDFDAQQEYFIENLIGSIEFIARTNKRLFLILPSFSNGWNPIDRLFSMEVNDFSFEEARLNLRIPKKIVNKRFSRLREELFLVSNEFENIILIDPSEYFCSEDFCTPLNSEGDLLFSDGNHFSLKANNLIYEEVLNSLKEMTK